MGKCKKPQKVLEIMMWYFAPTNSFFVDYVVHNIHFFNGRPQSTSLSQKLKIKTRTLNDNRSDMLQNGLIENWLISAAIHLLNAAMWNQDAL
jgi:hypothetical protein